MFRIRHRSRKAKALAAVAGAAIAGSAAFAATNWATGLNSGSSALAQSAQIANLSITAAASPSPTNLLYPGGTGDAVLTITNPNPYPVTVTALNLPTSSTYAAGYTTSALTTANGSCTASQSFVAWNYATATSGTSHTLTSPLTVAANGTLTATMTGDVAMGTGAAAACAGTYFQMPSFTGVAATGGAGTATTSPTTDSWTS